MPYISEDLADKKSCNSCSRPIYRVLTKNQKSTVVDVEASHDGTLRLERSPQGLTATFVPMAERPLHVARKQLYVSHFATCPQATEWRRT